MDASDVERDLQQLRVSQRDRAEASAATSRQRWSAADLVRSQQPALVLSSD
jgi:hypothetical protein